MGSELPGAGIVAVDCAATGVPLLHASTDHVFDGTKSTAYLETDPVAPLGGYGVSKEAGESAVRGAWVYVRHGANFLRPTVNIASERDSLRVVDDQSGNPTAVDAQAAHTGYRPPAVAISTAEIPTAARRPANSRLDSACFSSTFGFTALPRRSCVEPVVAAVLPQAAGHP